MTTIWKYEFAIADGLQTKEMPRAAEIVHVSEQGGLLCVWALVVPQRAWEKRNFTVHGTGHPIDPDSVYRGTAHIGAFVWHLFEALEAGRSR